MCTCVIIQFEQFAVNLEQSFMDLTQKLQSFKNEVMDIKKACAHEQRNTKYKNSMFKRVPRAKKFFVSNALIKSTIEEE